MFNLPPYAGEVLEKLESAGFEAWCVGGCVRDALLGRAPADWDICTSALPEETKKALDGIPQAETGLQHGTVTALTQGGPVEVTTFRREGAYSDHRRPDKVEFTACLEEDLQRRDFTINAMAWHPQRGLRDCFGGREDLQAGLLRCVGEPARRFQEDALRILRCLRFQAVLGFAVEENTEKALRALACLLEGISGERVQAEMDKLLAGAYAEKTLRTYADVFRTLFPEILCAEVKLPSGGGAAGWAALLQGLPAGQAEGVLRHLRFSNRRRKEIMQIWAGNPLPMGKLAVQGRDLLALGCIPGPGMGEVLHVLLRSVQKGESPNEREALLDLAGKLLQKDKAGRGEA